MRPFLSKRKNIYEIDYEKLAEAIVKTQNKTDEKVIKNAILDAYKQIEMQKTVQVEQPKPVKKESFFKVVFSILSNKRDTKGRFTTGLFTFMTSIILKAISLFGMIISVVALPITVYATCKIISNGYDWLYSVLIAIVIICICILIFLFMIIVWGASNEIEREQDRYFIISLFSGIVSFAALVVAIIALVKDI